MPKQAIEAEVISQPEGYSYKERYTTYSEQTKKVSVFAWIMGLLSLAFSLIPVFGFIFGLIALTISLIKKTAPVLPILALIISGFITTLFLLVVAVFRAIF